MRYWSPFAEDAVEQMKADGIEKLVIIPLYPQVRGRVRGGVRVRVRVRKLVIIPLYPQVRGEG